MPAEAVRNNRHSWSEAARAFLHRRVIALLFLGFSAGVPLLLIFSTLSLWRGRVASRCLSRHCQSRTGQTNASDVLSTSVSLPVFIDANHAVPPESVDDQ